MKTPATENEYNELEYCHPQIKTPDYTENKIKIDEMKQNIIRELTKVTSNDMKVRALVKKIRRW